MPNETPSLPPLFRDQRVVDANHIRLLAIFHFVRAGLSFLGFGFVALHCAIMTFALTSPQVLDGMKGEAPPKFVLTIFWVFYGLFGTWLGLNMAGSLAAGICLLRRRARVFCLVVAGFNCLSLPLGTTLGVFTFVVLLRESVRELYAAESAPREMRPPGTTSPWVPSTTAAAAGSSSPPGNP